MRDTTERATRKKLTWDGLTPRDAWNTGDVVDVWDHDDDRSYTGTYLGMCEYHGRPNAEITDCDSEDMSWFFGPDDPVTIRLVRASRHRQPQELAGEVFEPLHKTEERLELADMIAESRAAGSKRARPWRRAVIYAAFGIGIAWVIWHLFFR